MARAVKSKLRVQVTDLGWDRIKADLAELGTMKAEVGIQHGESVDGVSLAAIGMFNEFGTKHSPERSFIRTAFDENTPGLIDAAGKLTQAVIDDAMTPDNAIRVLGELHQGQVVDKIDEITTPPNAPSTIARKKSSKPLIDTGDMRAAVRYLIRKVKGKGEAE